MKTIGRTIAKKRSESLEETIYPQQPEPLSINQR